MSKSTKFSKHSHNFTKTFSNYDKIILNHCIFDPWEIKLFFHAGESAIYFGFDYSPKRHKITVYYSTTQAWNNFYYPTKSVKDNDSLAITSLIGARCWQACDVLRHRS